MPTIVGILTFMSMINFLLSRVVYVKSFITSGLGEPKTDIIIPILALCMHGILKLFFFFKTLMI